MGRGAAGLGAGAGRRLTPRLAGRAGAGGEADGDGEGGPLGLEIRDFGPIASASVALRPLTVFIGPNNSGKSYAARLLHTVVNALAGLSADADGGSGGGRALPACRRMVAKGYDGETGRALLGAADSRRAAAALIEEGLGARLRGGMERNFVSPAAGLVRAGQGKSTVTISGGSGPCPGLQRIRVSIGPRGGLSVEAGLGGGLGEIALARGRGTFTASMLGAGVPGRGARATYLYREQGGRRIRPGDRDGEISMLTLALADAVAREARRGGPGRVASHYLPSGRSAAVRACGRPAAGALRAGPRRDGAALRGEADDLAAGLMRIGGQRGAFFRLACDMERELLQGRIEAARAGRAGPPAVLRGPGGLRLPLRSASSSALELAPLSLYLKHVVGERSVLVVEEPEAHLHPASVVVLAKHIVRLVRGGLYVVITTHSPYMLEKLAQYALAGELSVGDRVGRLGYGRGDYLRPDEVSAYRFRRDGAGACRAAKIEWDDEFGISQEEFTDVDVDLNRGNLIIHHRRGPR